MKRVFSERHSIFTLEGVLTSAECAALVDFAEGIGFSAAPITTAFGFVMAPEVRDNTRVMLDDRVRAHDLWSRLASVVPPTLDGWRATGLNERFRFYRYDPGQSFKWHYDGSFVRDEKERSRLTLLLYLNEGFDGGATEFDLGEPLAAKPPRGSALFFAHRVRHQGACVTRGRKYVLRTDVMYRRDAVT